ncbi:hypothetical protein Vretimale_15559 [Volvox reticuliferus]|uniref:Uncharacterized protein n=1 Tax=Volvox reticuliferus TaxID=1737510 RepID=A0A8J4GP99_9CHLO|nr:hypothetical protein Vretimale_15559 [Volvox reticuliferus]
MLSAKRNDCSRRGSIPAAATFGLPPLATRELILGACKDRLRAGSSGSWSCCTISPLEATPWPTAATGFTIPVALTAHRSLTGDASPLSPTGCCSSWTPVDTVSTEDMEWGRRKMDDGLPQLLAPCDPYAGSRAGSPAVRVAPGERQLEWVGEPTGEPSNSCGLVLKLAQRTAQGLEARSLARREIERRRMLSSRAISSWPLVVGAVA